MPLFTAEDLKVLSDDKLEELDARLDRMCWTMSSPAYARRGQALEDALGLVEDELEARGLL